jgi:hypothetical protein
MSAPWAWVLIEKNYLDPARTGLAATSEQCSFDGQKVRSITVRYLYWFSFDNADQRRRGRNRTELETRLFKEQPVFLFSSFNAAGKYHH